MSLCADDMQHLLDVLDTFYHISGLNVDADKTKMMAVKAIHPRY